MENVAHELRITASSILDAEKIIEENNKVMAVTRNAFMHASRDLNYFPRKSLSLIYCRRLKLSLLFQEEYPLKKVMRGDPKME